MVRQTACLVVTDDVGRVLLGLREDFEVWSLPGGHVEPGETHEQAARREGREETGVQVGTLELIGQYERDAPFGGAVTYAFAGRLVTGTPAPDGVETLDVGWFDPRSLPPMLWWNKPAIADLAGGRRDVRRRISVSCSLGEVTRAELLAHRDRSPLSRADFFNQTFPEPDLSGLDVPTIS
jgi:ADP-ribose pyrophosphatase YjhB (NUDIX family)